MRKLSSSLTWWYKKAFPVYFFGFLGLFTLGWIPAVVLQRVPAPSLLVPVALAAFGYVLMRMLVFRLVDEVWTEDAEIVVRNRSEEDRFPITNIINVEAPLFVNPEHLVLTLRESCRFGREIRFMPPFRWWRMSRHPLAEELIRRAHRMDEGEWNTLDY